MMKKRFYALVFCCTIFFIPLFGQLRPSSDTTVNACTGLFYDSGGPTGAHGAQQRYAVIFCPETGGGAMRLAFGALDIGPGDSLCIYDGNGPGAPLLGCITAGRYRDSLFFQATVNNTSACLRVEFSSDGQGQGSGWGAAFSCGLPCQPMEIKVDSIDGLAPLAAGNVRPGCIGQELFLRVSGVYPFNGAAYTQSDLTTLFSWSLEGDPVKDGRALNFLPEQSGEYAFSLLARDERGCRYRFTPQKVIIQPRPVFSFPKASGPVCQGDTLRIAASFGIADPNRQINVLPGTLMLQNGSVWTAGLAALRWRFQPEIFFQLQDSIAAVPDNAGLYTFRVIAEDIYGCSTENPYSVPVLSAGDTACGACLPLVPLEEEVVLCAGDSLQVDVSSAIVTDSTFSFKTNPQYPFGFDNHPHGNPYASLLPVSGVPLKVLGDPLKQIEKICLNISTDWAEDIHIFLRSPDGRVLELSTGNGGGFDDYRNTCFSPVASNSITSGTAPFTGTFRPEGDWEVLKGSTINGDWALLVSDGFDTLRFGRLDSWTIAFVAKDSVRYSWSPAEEISCVDCPAPIIRPLRSTMYRVEIEGATGCRVTDSLHVVVRDSLQAPIVACRFDDNGSAIFTWGAIPGSVGYQVRARINGRDSTFRLSELLTGFSLPDIRAGDSLFVGVKAIAPSSDIFCGAREGVASCVLKVCNITVRLAGRREISCFGKGDGAVEFAAQNGSGGYTYQLNGSGSFQANPRFEGLVPGQYFVIAKDGEECVDSLFFEFTEPQELRSAIRLLEPISCGGGTDGAIEAFPEGGSLPYRFSWSDGSSTARLDSLGEGVYRLTVTDARSCAVQDSFRLQAPQTLRLQLAGTGPTCSNKADGSISATVTGGTAPLQYSWNTGSTAASVSGLGPGQYCLMVTDRRNCEVKECISISAPAPLLLDSITVSPVDCPGGNNGAATGWPTGGTPPYRYIWSDPLAQAGRQATNLTAGLIRLEVRDSLGCSVSREAQIPAPEPIRIDLSPVAASCKGSKDGSVTSTVSGGTSPFTYIWSNGSTSQNPAGLISGDYQVTITDSRGCKATAGIRVGEPDAALQVEVIQRLRGCIGEKKNVAGVRVSGGNAGNLIYRWSNGAQGPEASGLDSITYSVTVTDSKGCSQESSLKMTDLPQIVPNMIVRIPSCFNGSDGAIGINFVNGRPGADLAAFRFDWSTGASGTTIGGLRGDREYTVTVTDPQGCTAVVTRYVRQPRPLTIALIAGNTSCFGGKDGTVTVSAIEADTRRFSYAWNVPATGSTTSLTGLGAGIYRVTVTDEFNCTGEAQAVVSQPPALSIQFAITGNRCFGDSSGVVQVFGNGGTPPYRFTWPDGSTAALKTSLKAGSYPVTLTDAKGCQIVNPAVLQPPAPLNIRLGVQDVTCNGGRDGALQIAVSGGKPPLQYSTDGKNFRPSPTIIGLRAAQYTITVQDANGCSASAETRINEPPPFEVDAGPSNVSIKLGDTLVLKAVARGAQGGVKYSWVPDFPGTLSCTSCETTVVLTQNSISYVLNARDSAGCEARDRITVNVRKDRDILVPTGFSPNGDGNNDLLLVHGLSGTRVLSFRVYDRWGELVYEGKDFIVNDPTVGWDGNFRGQPMNPGVFVWFLEAEYIDGYKETKRGQTTLVR